MAGVFQKYLREYGHSVLQASLPAAQGAAAATALSMPALVTNLHTLLRDDAHSDTRYLYTHTHTSTYTRTHTYVRSYAHTRKL